MCRFAGNSMKEGSSLAGWEDDRLVRILLLIHILVEKSWPSSKGC